MRAEHWIYTIPLRLRSILRRGRVERDLDDELRFHVDREVFERVRQGEDPQEARRQALRAIDGLERTKEDCRDMRRTNGFENLIRDLRYAARTLGKSPLFIATAAVTLALGIGASTAVFSVTNAVLLQPLPYRSADRLALIFWENLPGSGKNFLYSNADFFDVRSGSTGIFEDIGGVTSFRAFVPREDGSAEQISKALVTTNFFRLMGATIALGRDFTEQDAVPQPSPEQPLIPAGSAAILSYEYWQRRYGGSTDVLGKEMAGSGQRGPRIIGVLAPGFKLFFPPTARMDATPDFWVANNIGYDTAHRGLLTVGAIGRLKAGETLTQAQQQLDAIAPVILKNSLAPKARMRLEAMQRYLVEEVRPAILALMGSVLFLLLIACANVANLLLVRGSLREREWAVRTALGGSWWRLVSQMLAEALLLSAVGTLLGVALAWPGIRVLAAIAPANVPRIDATAIDWRVVGFAALAGLSAVAFFGLIPALRAARPDVIQSLRSGGRATGWKSGGMLSNGVVIAEIALSFVLLVGSGLMFRSFLELRRIDPGYDHHGILTFFATREWPLMRQEGRLERLREIQARLLAIPGVQSVTAALILPPSTGSRPLNPAAPSDAPKTPGSPPNTEGADAQQVMPGYFETLHTPLLAGRTFAEADNAPGRNLVIVDQLYAERNFPNQSAIGQRIQLPGPGSQWAEVIGVVAHQRLFSLADPGRPTVYFSDGFWGIGMTRSWMLRTEGNPAAYAAAVRAELAKVDRQMVISKMRTMDELVEADQAGTRFSLVLIGGFAGVAVILAELGLYGVLATVVRRRTAEIGVRMALGAAPSGIFRLVVGHGLRLSAAGIAAGLVAAFALTRAMTALLVGIRPTDPATFAAMTVVFFLIAGAASWIPARRAAGLDPTVALREE